MIEDSPESFVSRWRKHAASVELYPRNEGSPLLEARAGGTLVQLFERTGPYLGKAGAAQVIIHPVTDGVQRVSDPTVEPGIEVTGVSRFEVCGRVVSVDGRMAVVDAGVPLVVAVLQPPEQALQPGELISFVNQPPAHAFVVVDERRGLNRREEHKDDTI